jgi:hypothetical protein
MAGAPALAQGVSPYNGQPADAAPVRSWSSAPDLAAEPVRPTAFQQPGVGGMPGAGGLPPRGREEAPEYKVQLEPPGPERLFRLQSEARLKEQMRQESRHLGGVERIIFPEEALVSTDKNPPRRVWPDMQEIAEPNYVCYGRLYFEQRNAERYGWELGILQPFISAGTFFTDVVLLPYHIGTEPCRCYDSNAGYCLPGDAVPYLLYPPDISLTGLAAEAVAVGGLAAVFP